jgi:ribonuclease-3
MAHRSWCAETPGVKSNERLEFLGDAVLGLVVTDHIFRTYPDLPEGELAKVRAAVVNAGALAELAAELELGRALHLGKGEDASGGREKPSILADAMEAVIGAVYIDGGYDAARSLIMGLLGDRIEEAAAAEALDQLRQPRAPKAGRPTVRKRRKPRAPKGGTELDG